MRPGRRRRTFTGVITARAARTRPGTVPSGGAPEGDFAHAPALRRRLPYVERLSACVFEPAEPIVGARGPRVHGLNFPEHIGKQRLMAVARVIEPRGDRSEDTHVIAQTRYVGDDPLILTSKKVQIGVGHNHLISL